MSLCLDRSWETLLHPESQVIETNGEEEAGAGPSAASDGQPQGKTVGRFRTIWQRVKRLLPGLRKKKADGEAFEGADLEAAVADKDGMRHAKSGPIPSKISDGESVVISKIKAKSLRGNYKGHAAMNADNFKVSMRTLMQKYEYTLPMASTVEFAGWSNKGVFFNIINRSQKPVRILHFMAGAANGGSRDATVYACKNGACDGNESEPGKWYTIWSGVLLSKKSTLVELSGNGVVVEARKTMGFFLHSVKDGVCYSMQQKGAKDKILEVEPWFATNVAGEAYSLREWVDEAGTVDKDVDALFHLRRYLCRYMCRHRQGQVRRHTDTDVRETGIVTKVPEFADMRGNLLSTTPQLQSHLRK